MNGPEALLEAVRGWAETATGRPAFIMQAVGRPPEPYVVIEPRWYSEPDVGAALAGEPTAQTLAIHANSYGRRETDALWLDERLYAVFVDEPRPSLAVEVLFLEGDSSPVLTFTRTGHILSKHTYRLTYR